MMDAKSKTVVWIIVIASVACIAFCTFEALCPVVYLCEFTDFAIDMPKVAPP